MSQQLGPKPEFSIQELIQEAQRELAMRQKVYERRCLDGKMRPADRDRKIGLQKAIIARLIKTAAY